MLTRAELSDLIARAFDGVRFYGRISLRQGMLIDNWVNDSNAHETARTSDETGDWDCIPDTDIREFGTMFTYIDEAAVPFYLPALMHYCLRHWNYHDTDHILGILLPAFERSASSCSGGDADRFSQLSDDQRAAVTAFLEFVADYSRSEFDTRSAKNALRKRWLEYKDWSI